LREGKAPGGHYGAERYVSGVSPLDERRKTKIRRRDVLIAVTATSVAAAMGAKAPASTDAAGRRNKRRAQYQPNSPEVQTFYRVNRYPAK
jgi:hypothetical protein